MLGEHVCKGAFDAFRGQLVGMGSLSTLWMELVIDIPLPVQASLWP